MFGFHVTPENMVVLSLLIMTACCLGALIIDINADAISQPVLRKAETPRAARRPVSTI